MAFKWDTGEDFSSGSTYLSEPGLYHLVVTGVDESPRKANGELIHNAAFSVTCSVVAGSVSGQEDKTVSLTFFAPNLSGKDQGKFARKKIDRFLLAVNLLRKDQAGAKGVEIDLQKAQGQQFLAKLEKDDQDKYMQIAFADIFHVDDPDAAGFPKQAEAIGLIDPANRLAKADAEPNGRKQQKTAPKQAAKSAATVDDLVI